MARKKLQYQSTSNTFFVAPAVVAPINVFSAFSQPAPINKVVAHQQPQVTFEVGRIVLAVTPATLVFTKFSEPAVHSGTQNYIDVDVSNSPMLPVAPVTQISVFTKFSQPQVFKTTQDTSFAGWRALPPVSAVVQNYVFSKFEQPQAKRVIDTSVGFITLPVVIISPPVFTGFNNFGLTQQTLGTQSKQDGSSVLFEVLQPTFVPSVYTFTGFSDFSTLVQGRSTHVERYTNDVIFVPTVLFIIPSDPLVGGKEWRWKEGYNALHKHHTSKTENSSELDGVRKAAAILSRLGGQARAEALTPKQRTNIASKAANVRWSKK